MDSGFDARRAQRIARQHLETTRLLGVGFVPVASEQPEVERVPEVHTTGSPATPPLLFGGAGGGPGRPAGPPELPAAEKAAALEALLIRHDQECPHCTTAQGHTRTVFGEGSADAALMFVGEAPGEEEDRTGRPFVGRAGRKLDDMIRAMGLRREDVYIANILKSRPPGNRTPLHNEVDACSPYLAEQIRIIRPAVLVALGGPAVKWMLGTTVGITRLRGIWAEYTDGALTFPVMPTFHPAFLLRNYTKETRAKVWSDMQAVMERLGLHVQKQ